MSEIDFVVLWVDGNDPKWREEKNKYLEDVGVHIDNRNARYRDWNNMMYWFRGVEKFAPWVRKVHFVTYGHLPAWLNTACPKLNVVKHSDFIPAEYLPCFNSSALEIHFHRLDDLSEKFVYFNDDMFLIDNVCVEDFFKNNLPVTFGCFGGAISPNRQKEDAYFGILARDAEAISKLYNKRKTILLHPMKFFSPAYGKQAIHNFLTLFDDSYVIDSTHMPQAFTKSNYQKMWQLAPEVMEATASSRFRSGNNINQDLFKSLQVLTVKFTPQSRKIGTPLFFANEERVKDVITNQRFKMCCVADDVTDDDFDAAVERLRNYFETILPEKSQFEI